MDTIMQPERPAEPAPAVTPQPVGIIEPVFGSGGPPAFAAAPPAPAFATTARPVYVSTAPPLDPARRNRT